MQFNIFICNPHRKIHSDSTMWKKWNHFGKVFAIIRYERLPFDQCGCVESRKQFQFVCACSLHVFRFFSSDFVILSKYIPCLLCSHKYTEASEWSHTSECWNEGKRNVITSHVYRINIAVYLSMKWVKKWPMYELIYSLFSGIQPILLSMDSHRTGNLAIVWWECFFSLVVRAISSSSSLSISSFYL